MMLSTSRTWLKLKTRKKRNLKKPSELFNANFIFYELRPRIDRGFFYSPVLCWKKVDYKVAKNGTAKDSIKIRADFFQVKVFQVTQDTLINIPAFHLPEKPEGGKFMPDFDEREERISYVVNVGAGVYYSPGYAAPFPRKVDFPIGFI